MINNYRKRWSNLKYWKSPICNKKVLISFDIFSDYKHSIFKYIYCTYSILVHLRNIKNGIVYCTHCIQHNIILTVNPVLALLHKTYSAIFGAYFWWTPLHTYFWCPLLCAFNAHLSVRLVPTSAYFLCLLLHSFGSHLCIVWCPPLHCFVPTSAYFLCSLVRTFGCPSMCTLVPTCAYFRCPLLGTFGAHLCVL